VTRILLDINHPSQAHIVRAIYEACRARGHELEVVARDKDVTLDLLRAFRVPFTCLSRPRRGRLGAARELVERELRFYRVVRRFRPRVLLGTSVHAARASRLFGGRSVILNEDDAGVVPLFARIAYPFAHRIVTPECLEHEAWGDRHKTYPGTQKLFYLHRDRFRASPGVPVGLGLRSPFGIVRLSSLTAHHDVNKRGLDRAAVAALAARLRGRVELHVSTEKADAPPEGTRLLVAPPEDVHHVMAAARFVLSDSQSMTAESALLGVPAIRVNDFVGRISYLAELERLGLAYGFRPEETGNAVDRAASLALDDDAQAGFRARRDKYFETMPDPLPWLVTLIEALAEEA
jgi:predicted glycosyltransferase